jgi:hypothetical protein
MRRVKLIKRIGLILFVRVAHALPHANAHAFCRKEKKEGSEVESARKMSPTTTKRRRERLQRAGTKRGIKHRRACVRCKHIIEGIKRN